MTQMLANVIFHMYASRFQFEGKGTKKNPQPNNNNPPFLQQSKSEIPGYGRERVQRRIFADFKRTDAILRPATFRMRTSKYKLQWGIDTSFHNMALSTVDRFYMSSHFGQFTSMPNPQTEKVVHFCIGINPNIFLRVSTLKFAKFQNILRKNPRLRF